jgi:hypothetical protein
MPRKKSAVNNEARQEIRDIGSNREIWELVKIEPLPKATKAKDLILKNLSQWRGVSDEVLATEILNSLKSAQLIKED